MEMIVGDVRIDRGWMSCGSSIPCGYRRNQWVRGSEDYFLSVFDVNSVSGICDGDSLHVVDLSVA